jgi:hypothetical protein
MEKTCTMGTATRDDVWLCLHLYEQRREPVLREAREWMIGFNPKSFREIKDVIEGRAGADANRFWRQATSYWEMISALMMSTGVTPECRELFAGTTREFFLFYAKLAPWIGEFRATYRPTAFQNLERFCKSLPDYEASLAYFTRMIDQIRSRVRRTRTKKR